MNPSIQSQSKLPDFGNEKLQAFGRCRIHELNVNRSRHEIPDATRTWLEVLPDDLGLVGAKEGCGAGMCGTCTVLVEGKPVSSCLTSAAQVADKEILTVEGLAIDGKLHPIQQAFIDERAFQRAYCTPGFFLDVVIAVF